MIRSHLVNLVAYSAIVASVFAVLLRDEPRSRLRFGAGVFGALLLCAVLAGWLMARFPG